MRIFTRNRTKKAIYLFPFVLILFCYVRKEIQNHRDKVDFSKLRHSGTKYIPSPADDYAEAYPAGTVLPGLASNPLSDAQIFTNASIQPTGALSGRIIFVNAGHGWVYNNGMGANAGWHTGRGVYNGIIEDYGNIDQMNLFVPYCFNAGAVIVPFRPIGRQTNEVVLDNMSPDVSYQGKWLDSESQVYFGSAGQVPYRYAFLDNRETATSVYAPKFPATGAYPVYTWVRHGSDRTSQLYRVRHTGGETVIRIPHFIIGNGWVYLGTYYFDAGQNSTNGSVVISNLRAPDAPGSVVIADAIRFGNGLGDIIPRPRAGERTKPSGYPREEECARYWIQAGIGQGQPAAIYEGSSTDENDNVNAPPRMARQMNRETAGRMRQRVFLSFHSNSNGRRRGCLGLYNHPMTFPLGSTSNQEKLAQLLGSEVNDTLVKLTGLPIPWYDREKEIIFSRSDFAFGEINNASIGDEFDAAILEVGYHDNTEDAALLREPLVRQTIAQSAYRGTVRYMNEFDDAPLVFLPDPPESVRATATDTNKIQISWSIGTNAPPDYFTIYQSADGYGYGAPIRVPGNTTTASLAAGHGSFLRITASNAGGESLMSPVVGVDSKRITDKKVLFVNAFHTSTSALNLRQTAGPGIGGPSGGIETFERVIPSEMNSFDYVVQYGKAFRDCGIAFDSCDSSDVRSGQMNLSTYSAVVWAMGRETSLGAAFTADEQKSIRGYLATGGNLFVSGCKPNNTNCPAADAFTRGCLGLAAKATMPITNSVSLQPSGDISKLDITLPALMQSYDIAEILSTNTVPMLRDTSGNLVAGRFQSSVAGSGKVVAFTFPYESITSETARGQCMRTIFEYFGLLPSK